VWLHHWQNITYDQYEIAIVYLLGRLEVKANAAGITKPVTQVAPPEHRRTVVEKLLSRANIRKFASRPSLNEF